MPDEKPVGEVTGLLRRWSAGDPAERARLAMQTLHDHQIVHRDLKPSNVMLVPAGSGERRAVVMDFGLAKAQHSDHQFFETRDMSRVGNSVFYGSRVAQG